jgi:hypothetical protein
MYSVAPAKAGAYTPRPVGQAIWQTVFKQSILLVIIPAQRRDDDHSNDQFRVACHLPLHLSPVIIPLHRPVPELPASRPLPVATDAPTDILTETAPLGLIPPVTLPPPADETRPPDTANGTLLAELQLPARVANTTFQVPS